MEFLVEITNWLTNSQLYGLNKQEKKTFGPMKIKSQCFLTKTILEFAKALSCFLFFIFWPSTPPLYPLLLQQIRSKNKRKKWGEIKRNQEESFEETLGQLCGRLLQALSLEISGDYGKQFHPQALDYDLNSWPCIYDEMRD